MGNDCGNIGGKAGEARGKSGVWHGVGSGVKRARLTVGIDRQGTYIKATRQGVFGPTSFARGGVSWK